MKSNFFNKRIIFFIDLNFVWSITKKIKMIFDLIKVVTCDLIFLCFKIIRWNRVDTDIGWSWTLSKPISNDTEEYCIYFYTKSLSIYSITFVFFGSISITFLKCNTIVLNILDLMKWFKFRCLISKKDNTHIS